MKELNPNNYKEHLPLDIIAYLYAVPGAMGEGGQVIIVTRDGTCYHLNYYYDEWPEEDLFAVCPPLAGSTLMLFGDGDSASGNWRPLNLGMGNHLFVAEDYADDLVKAIGNQHPYQAWLGCLQEIITGRNSETNEDIK